MRRFAAIVLVSVLIGTAAWLLSSGETGPNPIGSPPNGGSDASGPRTGSLAAADVADAAVAAGRRPRPSRGADPRLLDPAIAAALGGFVGRVVTYRGDPQPGARVRIYRGDVDALLQPGVDYVSELTNTPRIEPRQATTAEDGRFRIDGAWPRGAYLLRVDFAEPDRVDAAALCGHDTFRIVQRTPAAGEIVDLGDVVLEQGASLSGRVVDQAGRPIAGALVRAAQMPGAWFAIAPLERLDPAGGVLFESAGDLAYAEFPPWARAAWDLLPVASDETGADGVFVLHGVEPGGNVVAATAAGFASFVQPRVALDPGEVRHLGDVVLRDGVDVVVQVVDAEGEPLASAEVVLGVATNGPNAHLVAPVGTTDADGELVVPGFPARARAVGAARRRPEDPWVAGEVRPVDDLYTIRMRPVHSLTVRVQDSSGEVVADPRLKLVSGGFGVRVVGARMMGFGRPLPLAGRMVELEDGSVRIADLPRGVYTLFASADGHPAVAIDVRLEADRTEVVHLGSARSLEVEVLDPDGRPLRNAAVYALPLGPSRERLSDIPLHCGITGGDGALVIDEIATPRGRVTARHPAFGAVHAETAFPGPKLVLRMLTPGILRGVLLEGGQPPDRGRWTLVLQRRYEGASRGALREMPQLRTPPASGAFTFAGLQPGRYRLTAHHSMDAIGGIGSAIEFFGARRSQFPFINRDLDVRSGEVVDVVIDAFNIAEFNGPGATIRGSVVLDGRPGRGLIVTAHMRQIDMHRAAKVGADGAFDLGHVLAGPVELRVLPAEIGLTRRRDLIFNHLWRLETSVEAGVPQVHDIAIETGGVTGTVVDAAGAAVQDAEVRLLGRGQHDGSGANLRARSDGLGRFSFTRVPEGSYAIDARRSGVGHGRTETFVFIAGQHRVEVALESFVTLRGRIGPELFGHPVPKGVVVRLAPSADGAGRLVEAVSAPVAADGTFVVRDVVPGRYRAFAHGPGADREHEGPVDVGPGGVADFVFRPRAR